MTTSFMLNMILPLMENNILGSHTILYILSSMPDKTVKACVKYAVAESCHPILPLCSHLFRTVVFL